MKNVHPLLLVLGLLAAASCILIYAVLSVETDTPSPTPTGLNPTQVASATALSEANHEIIPVQTHTTEVTVQPTLTPNPFQQYGIYMFDNFETGSLQNGEFIQQGNSPYYQIVNKPIADGLLAAALTIDTSTSKNPQAAYFFYYDNPAEAWYSAWYYIPKETLLLDWWNIMQWKSTYNGLSNDSLPMWILDLSEIPNRNDLQISLLYRPDSETEKTVYTNFAFTIPKDEWFHISTYYKKSNDGDGAISVWVDGQEMITLTDIHTVLRDNTLYWSVNHYSGEIMPYPSTLYVDNIIVSQERIPPELSLP